MDNNIAHDLRRACIKWLERFLILLFVTLAVWYLFRWWVLVPGTLAAVFLVRSINTARVAGKIDYDPETISYDKILEIFWHIHDPTSRDRQGSDVGPMYRSIILTTDIEQARKVDHSMREIANKLWDDPIVTESVPLDDFYEAEDYHQNYFNNNPDKAYCQAVINPKLAKFQKEFASWLKDESTIRSPYSSR